MRDKIVKQQREELVNQSFAITSLQENLNTKLAKIESLFGEIKRHNREVETIREERERD